MWEEAKRRYDGGSERAEQASCIRQRPEGDEGTHSLVENFHRIENEVFRFIKHNES